LFQEEVARAVSVPDFLSSLVQIPLAFQMTQAPVGVLTASAPALTERHIAGAGAAHFPIRVQGLDDSDEFAAVILRNERDDMDVGKIEQEVLEAGAALIRCAPEIKSIVLECSDLPPYARRLQQALKRPVFDLTTLATMVHNVVVQQSYSGF
jgi:hypothetical protein